MPKKETKHTMPSVSLSADVFDLEGKSVKTIQLPQDLFGQKPNKPLLYQATRVFLANQRSGTHSTKTRSHVSGTTKKMYRQKGTGRARHSTAKAPIFVGGGVAHGPHPKDYSLDLPRRMKKTALIHALSDQFQSGNIKIVTGIEAIEPKTKQMVRFLTRLHGEERVEKEKRTLFVLSDIQKNILLSGRNVSFLTLTQARLLHAYEVLSHRQIILSEQSISTLSDSTRHRDLREAKQEKPGAVTAKNAPVTKKTIENKRVTQVSQKEAVKKTIKRTQKTVGNKRT